jgi:hypothetical protein
VTQKRRPPSQEDTERRRESMRANRRPPRVYTCEETAEQLARTRTLLTLPTGTPTYVASKLRKEFGLGRKRAANLVERVLSEWSEGVDPRQSTKNRAQAAARIRCALLMATYKYVLDKDNPDRKVLVERDDPDLRAVFQLESLLMRLEGTDQPIAIDINVRMNDAAVAAIAALTVAQVSEIMARRAETARLAGIARASLPETITVHAEKSS